MTLAIDSVVEDKIRQRISEELQADYEKRERTTAEARGFLRALYLVLYGAKQTKQIEEAEADAIQVLRDGFVSYGDIAYIVNRSKSTVFDCIQRTPNGSATLLLVT